MRSNADRFGCLCVLLSWRDLPGIRASPVSGATSTGVPRRAESLSFNVNLQTQGVYRNHAPNDRSSLWVITAGSK